MADFLSSRQELPVHPLISSDLAFYKAAVWLSVRSVQHDSSSVRATWAAARSVAARSLPVFPYPFPGRLDPDGCEVSESGRSSLAVGFPRSGQVVIQPRCLPLSEYLLVPASPLSAGFQDLISHSGITISCRNYVQASNATTVVDEGVAVTGS